MPVYFLMFEFGFHHVLVEVPKKSFRKVVDDLSTEFTIHQTPHSPLSSVTDVWFYNYYGNRQNFGCFINVE